MTVRDGFAVFILSHDRPEFLARHTVKTLDAYGYTGPWFIVLDDDDETRDEYATRFGADRIKLFHKDDRDVDMGDNGGPTGVPIYARNAVDGIAAELGLTWLLMLDDDYTQFRHRYAGASGTLHGCSTRRLDEVIEFYLDFLEDTGALTVAFAQGGDMIGGTTAGLWKAWIRRKAMNSFFCRVGRPVEWLGRINEDTTAYVVGGARGEMFLTCSDFGLEQVPTQQAPGGLTDAYKQLGTYAKSFYTVMFAPSAVKVAVMGPVYDRMHHAVLWDAAVPKIIPQDHRKPLSADVSLEGAAD